MGGLHTCAYTSIARKNVFLLVKKYPKLHRPAVYATVNALVGCINYDWLLAVLGAYYCRLFDSIATCTSSRLGPSMDTVLMTITVAFWTYSKSTVSIIDCVYSLLLCDRGLSSLAFGRLPQTSSR
jgi:hypothetical protein